MSRIHVCIHLAQNTPLHFSSRPNQEHGDDLRLCVMASNHGRRHCTRRRRRGCGSWRTGWARTAARGTLSACTRRPLARRTTAAAVRRHAAVPAA